MGKLHNFMLYFYYIFEFSFSLVKPLSREEGAGKKRGWEGGGGGREREEGGGGKKRRKDN